MSTRCATRLLFTNSSHPLHRHTRLPDRTIRKRWLEEIRSQHTLEAVRHPSLKRPLALVARFLTDGDVMEDLANPDRGRPPPFSVAIRKVEEDGPAEHQDFLSTLPKITIFLNTDGSKLEN